MKVSCFASILALGASTAMAEPGLLRLPDSWIPYVERIDSKEIVLLENALNESLSAKSDLVIYSSDESGKIYFAFALRRTGDEWHLKCHKFDPSVIFSAKTIRLPRDVAERLMTAFELVLTKQVFPVTQSSNGPPKTPNSGIWIYLRASGGATALGKILVPAERCWVGVPESNRSFFEIYYRLGKLFDDVFKSDAPITELDIALRQLPSGYPK